MNAILSAAVVVALAVSLPPAAAAKEAKPKPVPCKEPEVKDPKLASGLALYLEGQWVAAGDVLQAWAQLPESASDPSAGRGLYCLAYATRQRGDVAGAERWYAKAEPLLQARLAEAPSLELYYYLQALHQSRGNTAAHLAVVSDALKLLEEGRLCAKPDGDDCFRLARLAAAAGRKAQERELLTRADASYAKGKGSVVAYRAFTAKGLADIARAEGDFAGAEKRYLSAAALDPSVPGVHWGVGLMKLQQGDVQGAADYWRTNWKRERQDGNALNYAIPVLDRLARRRAQLGDKGRVENLAEYTVPALEQNIQLEAQRLGEADAAVAAARQAGQEPTPEQLEASDVADYRLVQFTADYIRREQPLQEFALKHGLLGALLRRGLPAPKASP